MRSLAALAALDDKVPTPRPLAAVVSIDAGAHRQEVRRRRDDLIARYSYLVRPIAASIRLPRRFELEDLIQTGMMGLLHAATRYRPESYPGVPFGLYARRIIRGAILDSVRGRNWKNATMGEISHEPGEWPAIDEEIEHKQQAAQVRDAIRLLDESSQRVLASYYSEGGTWEKTAKVVGIDRRRASEVHDRAVQNIRAICVGA